MRWRIYSSNKVIYFIINSVFRVAIDTRTRIRANIFSFIVRFEWIYGVPWWSSRSRYPLLATPRHRMLRILRGRIGRTPECVEAQTQRDNFEWKLLGSHDRLGNGHIRSICQNSNCSQNLIEFHWKINWKLLNLDGMYTQFCFFFRSLRRSFRFHRMLFRQQQQHLLRIPDSRWQSASTTVCTHTHLCAIDRFFGWLKNQQARDCRASISLHLTHRRELTAFWFCCICSWAATNNRSSTHQSVAADRCFCYHMPKRIRHPSHQCRFEVRAFRYNNALGRYTWKLIEYVHVYTRLFFQCCYVPLPRCYYRTRTPAVSHQNI